MKLAFSMDALDAAGSRAWRLQADKQHWRSCIYAEPMQNQDARLEDRVAAETLHGRRMKRDKEAGLIIREKPGAFDFLMRGIFTHAVLHRFSATPIPDKEQMMDTIGKLEAATPWLLYVDVAGHFKALDTTCEPIIGNLRIAVRGEIASAEAYVGKLAAANEAMMDLQYRQFLGGWLGHLRSGNMAVFIPDAEKTDTQENYLSRINDWQHE